jgi:hypothetical protein
MGACGLAIEVEYFFEVFGAAQGLKRLPGVTEMTPCGSAC